MKPNTKNCQFCCEPIPVEASKCKYCQETQLAPEISIERLVYAWCWAITGFFTAFLLPLLVFSIISQNGETIIELGKAFFLVLTLPLWIPPLTGLALSGLRILFEHFYKKEDWYESLLYFQQRIKLRNRQVIVNNSVLLGISIILTLLLWGAHISRPNSSEFEGFVTNEFLLEEDQEYVVCRADYKIFTLDMIITADGKKHAYFGYFGRFTPYQVGDDIQPELVYKFHNTTEDAFKIKVSDKQY